MPKLASPRTARAAVGIFVLFVLASCQRPEKQRERVIVPVVAELSQARVIEPRLTSARHWAPCKPKVGKGHVVPSSDCGPPYLSQRRASLGSNEACEKAMTDYGETLRLLLTESACTDAAVRWLDDYANETGDAGVLSDLGAAFYVRAQKDDRPSDLLRSQDAAKRAIAADSRLSAAWFNLALAQEALGFSAQARASWDRVSQTDRTQWAGEAKEHMDVLDRAAARNAALRWPLNKQRLPRAVAAGDRASVAAFIAPFPAAAQKYLEEELLPKWASLSDRHSGDARAHLREAMMIAEELEKITRDPYMREAVERARNARSTEAQSLREAHIVFAQARALDRSLEIAHAEAAYEKAADHFKRAGSPLRLGAELGRAIQISLRSEDKREAEEKIQAVVRECRERGYRNVRGRALGNIANLRQVDGQYLEALALYDEVIPLYDQMDDAENLANAHIRKAGILRVLGQQDAALREAFLARQYSPRVVEMAARHVLAGETAAAVLALEFPRAAFDYQSAFIDALEREAPDSTNPAAKGAMRVNRAIALRARAAIRLHLDDREGAQKEIEEAVAISDTLVSKKTRNALRARIAEAEGDAALPADPKRAIVAFTDAINLSGHVRYRTFHAILLARRAEAYELAGQKAAAEADLVAAIAELNAEEAELLAGRPRGRGETLWSGYFSRFQETYGRLIDLLLARGRKREAFTYAEKSRAYEPLSLVLELPTTGNKTLRRLDPQSIIPRSSEAIQAALPAGTFVLEYQVGETETFVWIVSRDAIEVKTLNVGRKDITGWIRALQREAVIGDGPMFDSQLSVPYAKLFAAPLDVVGRLKHGRARVRRLVIVPDRYMHGLPFSALRNKRGRHLVQDFTISIAASATLYVHALRRDEALARSGGLPKALVIGNPEFDPTLELARDLPPLPFAELEARNAADLYAPHATLLVRKQATVPAFLSLAKDSVIVHVAGHAIANRQAPFGGTLLLLAPADGHDGLLYTEELLRRLELDRARLVVLAACSSAGGVPVGPEGLAPLVRPIVAAGVPGIVGSLWTIDDERSQRVLSEFHRHYRHGHDAARALQLAQIHFLREGKIPVLALAPFQVVGHASSPFPLSEQDE